MADECDISEIVTTFFLNTCRLPPGPSVHSVQAAIWVGLLATKHPPDDTEVDCIPLTTGSVAEFYIEPMIDYAGDIDVMYYLCSQLAIPRGHPPPSQLPAEFHNYVKVAEIIDSHLPGYVYLDFRYLLTQCIEDGKYNYFENDKKLYLGNRMSTDVDKNIHIHGPAVFTDNSDVSILLSIDTVYCVRCLSWPPQAADWPTRHRNYGWPDSATLDRVVSNGCDVVGVAHRQCKQHEWMGKHQFRLSFSRAEIVLINSWMPVQQIAYHILRFYVKTEQLTESADNSELAIMSNYHIKTLMLWACELKPRSWWTGNLNLVRICVELLKTLFVWLTDTRCPHYFINNCNLLNSSFNVRISVASKLMSIDEEYLSTWLMNNYIGQCAQLCPFYISRLFDDVSTSVKLQKAVSEIVRWRLNTSLYDMWQAVTFAELYISVNMSLFFLNVRSSVYSMNELAKIDKRFCVYFSAFALLHAADKISRKRFDDDSMDILATILGHNSNQCCSVLSLCKIELNTELVELLQKSAVEHLTTYRQLLARDFDFIVTIITTDFEAMYAYKRGDYQQCLQLSTQNVHTLLYAVDMPSVLLPEFTQLMDDDIASLTALTVITKPECRKLDYYSAIITQLTLSLYLMTQCQLKLSHLVTSLAHTLDYIEVVQRRHSREHTLDQLTLKLLECKVRRTIVH